MIQLRPSRVPRMILGTIKTELRVLSGENVAEPKATRPVHWTLSESLISARAT